jgi:hypothetical protein
MKRLGLALPVLLLFGSGSAFAQQYGYPGSYLSTLNRPQLSPYLNLARPGDPGINYFLLTIPEQQRRTNDALFRSQLQYLETRPLIPPVTTPEELFAPPPGSGHETAFMYYGGYFNQRGYQPPNRSATPPRTPPRPKGRGME